MSESKKYLCEEADNVTRFEVIGLSIMAYLDTHVKHDNSSVCRGVSLKDAREWIREQIKRNTPSEDLEKEMDKFFETMPVLEHENIFEDTFKNIARHFANWQKEQMMRKAEKWLREEIYIPSDDIVVDENGEPHADSYIAYEKERIGVINKIIDDFRKAMED